MCFLTHTPCPSLGLGKKCNVVHAIDFGLAKRYRDPRTHQHIPYRENKNLTGTARYASINTHIGIGTANGLAFFLLLASCFLTSWGIKLLLFSEQSRRDDLESLGYVLMYFIRGSLPWQGLKANTKKQKYERIMDRKMSTSTEQLCKGYPSEFRSYFEYCRSLRFEDRPDYAYLKRLFKELFYRKGFQYDNMFDWTVQNMVSFAPLLIGAHGLGALPHSGLVFRCWQQQERSRLGPDARADGSPEGGGAADVPRGREDQQPSRPDEYRDDDRDRPKVRGAVMHCGVALECISCGVNTCGVRTFRPLNRPRQSAAGRNGRWTVVAPALTTVSVAHREVSLVA